MTDLVLQNLYLAMSNLFVSVQILQFNKREYSLILCMKVGNLEKIHLICLIRVPIWIKIIDLVLEYSDLNIWYQQSNSRSLKLMDLTWLIVQHKNKDWRVKILCNLDLNYKQSNIMPLVVESNIFSPAIIAHWSQICQLTSKTREQIHYNTLKNNTRNLNKKKEKRIKRDLSIKWIGLDMTNMTKEEASKKIMQPWCLMIQEIWDIMIQKLLNPDQITEIKYIILQLTLKLKIRILSTQKIFVALISVSKIYHMLKVDPWSMERKYHDHLIITMDQGD